MDDEKNVMDARAWKPSFWTVVIACIAALPLLYFGVVRQEWMSSAQIVLIAALLVLATGEPVRMLFGALIVRQCTEAFSASPLFSIASVPLNLSVLVGFIVSVWAIAIVWKRRGERLRFPLAVPLLSFVGVQAATVLWSIAPSQSFESAVRLVSLALVFFAAYALFRERRASGSIAPAFAVAAIIPGLFGVLQWVTRNGMAVEGEPNRAFGTYTHPNTFGLALVVIIAVIGLDALVRRPKPRPWSAPVLLGLGVSLLLTYSRGAWLMLVVAACIVAARYYRKLFTRVLIGIGVFLALVVPLNGILFQNWNVDITRVPVVSRLLSSTSEEGSISWRIELWKSMERKFFERPFTGYGLSTFPILQERQSRSLFEGLDAHNDYLRLAIESGIAGLLTFLALAVSAVVSLIRAFRTAPEPSDRKLLFGAFALMVALLVESFFDNVLHATAVMWLFWIWLAYVLSLEVKKKEG